MAQAQSFSSRLLKDGLNSIGDFIDLDLVPHSSNFVDPDLVFINVEPKPHFFGGALSAIFQERFNQR